jgi:anti-sigma factor RsiW
MNKCSELDIKEMLPDLLHGKLDADARVRVEAHIASCGECAEELEVLRTVKSAAVFIPAIDVDSVVRQIPPYRTIVPVVEAPARPRPRLVSWLVAASLVAVVLGGGSLLMIQKAPTVGPVAAVEREPAIATTPVEREPAISTTPVPHALALASAVDGLSDNNLQQLMNDMNSFDALPVTEPGPAISVDNGDSLDQGSR